MGIDDLLDEQKVAEAQIQEVSTEKVEDKQVAVEEKTVENEVAEKVEAEAEPKNEDTTAKEKIKEESTLELNDDVVLQYFREKKQKEVNSIDDLFKEPEVKEVVKEVNPYADIEDDYIKGYVDFRKQTGLGRKEYELAQQDFSKKSNLDWAFEKIKNENKGLPLTNGQIKSHLETKLGIDFGEEELTASAQIELNSFVKSYKDGILELQNKYKATERQVPQKPEMVTLENGEQMEKAKFELLQKQRNEYIANLKENVSSATGLEIEYVFDNNGEKQTSKFAYEYSEKDKHGMLSNASDVNAFLGNKFKTDKGFDYKGLATFIDKAENFEKYLALAVNQARAEALETKIALDNNENFHKTTKQMGNEKTNTVDDLLDVL